MALFKDLLLQLFYLRGKQRPTTWNMLCGMLVPLLSKSSLVTDILWEDLWVEGPLEKLSWVIFFQHCFRS